MFRPNQYCYVHSTSGETDLFGMPLPSTKIKERCAVVKMKIRNEKSAVRTDTSASRGNAQELEAETVLLMTKTSKVKIDDNVELLGHQFRVMAVEPRFTMQGVLDHYEIGCTYWVGA